VILVGTNNTEDSAENIADGILELIRLVQTKQPQADVVVLVSTVERRLYQLIGKLSRFCIKVEIIEIPYKTMQIGPNLVVQKNKIGKKYPFILKLNKTN
jgi:hypothetical protein